MNCQRTRPCGSITIRSRMGPATPVRVKYAVAIDHLVIFVFQQRKVELTFEAFAEHLGEFFGVLMAVDADRQDLDPLFLLFRQ